MITGEQPYPVHGIQTIPWDHASLPGYFWANVRRMPNGCWITDWDRATGYRAMTVLRLLMVNPKEAWAMTPTCGAAACVNPAHLCVTMRTPSSKREMRPGQRSK